MKNLEWLKDKTNQSSVYTDTDSGVYGDDYVVSRELMLDLIDQVEQPEITIEQAMNKLAEKYPFNSASIVDILEGYAQQGIYEQPELPVMPEFVADYIRVNKESNYNVRDSLMNVPSEINKWLFKGDNMNTFARAWLDGYTVEEKEYVVKTEIGTYLTWDVSGRNWDYSEVPVDEDSIKYATKFKDKKEAEALAYLLGNSVEEINE